MENNKNVASYIDDIKARVTGMLPRIISWMLMKEKGGTLPELLAKAKKRYFAIATEQPEGIDYKSTYLSRMGNEDWNSYSLGVKAHYMAAMALYSAYDCGHLAMHMLDHMAEGNHDVGTEAELWENMRDLIDIPPFDTCSDWELLDHCARMAAYDIAFEDAFADGVVVRDTMLELAGASDNTLMDAYDKHRERYAKTLDLDKPEEDDDDDSDE